jgi:hypothetical protein
MSDDGSHFSYKATPVKLFVPSSAPKVEEKQETPFSLQDVH